MYKLKKLYLLLNLKVNYEKFDINEKKHVSLGMDYGIEKSITMYDEDGWFTFSDLIPQNVKDKVNRLELRALRLHYHSP